MEAIELTDKELDHRGGPATAVLVAVRASGETAWLAEFPKAQYVGRHRL